MDSALLDLLRKHQEPIIYERKLIARKNQLGKIWIRERKVSRGMRGRVHNLADYYEFGIKDDLNDLKEKVERNRTWDWT